MADLAIPASLRAAMHFMRGEEAGDRWLAGLPSVWAHYAREWHIEPEQVLTGGQMSCCVLCSDDAGRRLVLKIPADPAAGIVEAAALRLWTHTGAVPVLRHADDLAGVLLMDYIPPGPAVTGVEPFVQVLRRLGESPVASEGDPFAPLASNIGERIAWAEDRFAVAEYAALRPLLEAARALSEELTATAGNRLVIHGDLQRKNLLSGTDGRMWAIDPMPVTGEPEFDAAFWAVMQSNEDPPIAQTLNELAAQDRQMDVARLRAWAEVIAVVEFRPYLPDRHDRYWFFIRHLWRVPRDGRHELGFPGPVTTLSGLRLPVGS